MSNSYYIAKDLSFLVTKKEEEIKKLQDGIEKLNNYTVSEISKLHSGEDSENISFDELKEFLDNKTLALIANNIMDQRTLRPKEIDDTFLKLLLTNPNSKDHIVRKKFEKTFESLHEDQGLRVALFCHDGCITSEVCEYMKTFMKRYWRIEVLPIISTQNQLELHHPVSGSNQALISFNYKHGCDKELSSISRYICLLSKVYKSPSIAIKFPCIGRVRSVDLVIRDGETGDIRHPIISVNNGAYIYETTGNTYDAKIYDALNFVTQRLNNMAA